MHIVYHSARYICVYNSEKLCLLYTLRSTLLTALLPLRQGSLPDQMMKMPRWEGILLSPLPPFAAQACSGVGKEGDQAHSGVGEGIAVNKASIKFLSKSSRWKDPCYRLQIENFYIYSIHCVQVVSHSVQVM